MIRLNDTRRLREVEELLRNKLGWEYLNDVHEALTKLYTFWIRLPSDKRSDLELEGKFRLVDLQELMNIIYEWIRTLKEKPVSELGSRAKRIFNKAAFLIPASEFLLKRYSLKTGNIILSNFDGSEVEEISEEEFVKNFFQFDNLWRLVAASDGKRKTVLRAEGMYRVVRRRGNSVYLEVCEVRGKGNLNREKWITVEQMMEQYVVLDDTNKVIHSPESGQW